MKNFFISYNKADRAWAEWIAWQLEEAGYSVSIQAWDFRPGGNFVLGMQRAVAESQRTLAVLSPDYLASCFAAPEWAAAFAQDPTGEKGLLLPVRVRDCEPRGLLPQIVYIDLLNADESRAKTLLLAGLQRERAKPTRPPNFPTARVITERPSFPGAEPRSVPRQLPDDILHFVGRVRDIADLRRALSGHTRCAAITAIAGMGGVGKSALAVHVAHQMIERFPDGSIFINLLGTSDHPLTPETAMGKVIQSLGQSTVELPQDPGEVARLYRTRLAGKQLLIVFDNARDTAQVCPLMPPHPCAVMITSRQPIALEGVTVIYLDALAPSKARELLKKIIGQKRASSKELRAIAERCGFLPLALHVAGMCLNIYRDWIATDYLQALSDQRERLKYLRIEDNPSLDVAATLELSFERLAAEQQRLAERWQMLAVFPTNFDREGVAAVWEASLSEVREGLHTLTARSMVVFDAASNRYRLHDLMSDVARGDYRAERDARVTEELRKRLAEAANRHAGHYLERLAKANNLFRKGGSLQAGLELFDQEHVNIEAGWEWAARNMEVNNSAAELCNEYPRVGASLLSLRLHPRDRIRWHRVALSSARRLQDRRMECVHLGRLGVAHRDLGKLSDAIECNIEALQIAREIGDSEQESRALGHLALAYWDQGNSEEAINYATEALTITRKSGDRLGEAAILTKLGWAYRDLGQRPQALEYHELALKIVRNESAPRQEARVLYNLGLDHQDLRDLECAIRNYEEALEIACKLWDRRQECRILSHISTAYSDLGNLPCAIKHGEKALEIVDEVADHAAEMDILCNLGILHRRLGDARRAILYHKRYWSLAQDCGFRRAEARALDNMALDYEILADYSVAIQYLEHALNILQEEGDRLGEAYVLLHLAACLADRGETARAIQHIKEAQASFGEGEISDPAGEGHVMETLGMVHQMRGEHAKSIEFLERALTIKKNLHDRIGTGYVLGRLSASYKDAGEPLRAIEYAEQALQVARDFGDRRGEALVLNNLGAAHRIASQPQEAIACHAQALKLAEKFGFRHEEGQAHFETALALDKMRDQAAAISETEKALMILEEIEACDAARVRDTLNRWKVNLGENQNEAESSSKF